MEEQRFVESQKRQLAESKQNALASSFCLYAVTFLLKKVGIEEKEKGFSDIEFYDMIIDSWKEQASKKATEDFDSILSVLKPGQEEGKDLEKMKEDNLNHVSLLAAKVRENLVK